MPPPTPAQYAKELAAFIKNGLKDAADLQKRYDSLADDSVTHTTMEKHHAGLCSEFEDQATRVVQDAKDTGMTGTKLSDFAADKDVAALIADIAKFETNVLRKYDVWIDKYQKAINELIKDATDFTKPLQTELDTQKKAAAAASKHAGFDKGEFVKLEKIIAQGEWIAKRGKVDLKVDADALSLYTGQMISDLQDKIKTAITRTKADLKSIEAVKFGKLAFDHRRIIKNAGIAKTLFEEIGAVAKAYGRFQLTGPGKEMPAATMEKMITTAKAKAAGLQKIAAIHTQEWLKLGKDGMNTMQSDDAGRKSIDYLQKIEKHAENAEKLIKILGKPRPEI